MLHLSSSPYDNDCTCFTPLLKGVVFDSEDPSWLSFINDSCKADMVDNIQCDDTRILSGLQIFNRRGRVTRDLNYHIMHFRSDFSTPLVPSH